MKNSLQISAMALVVIYLLIGFAFALAMGEMIPALNWLGHTYIALTWGAVVICDTVVSGACSVFPPQSLANLFFTF